MKKVSGEVLPLSIFVSAVPTEMSIASLLYIDLAWSFHLSPLPPDLGFADFCSSFLPSLGLACCPLPDTSALSPGAAKPWKEKEANAPTS